MDVVRYLEDELSKVESKLINFPELKLSLSIVLQAISADAMQYVVLHGHSNDWWSVSTTLKSYEEQLRMCELPGSSSQALSEIICDHCSKKGHKKREPISEGLGVGRKVGVGSAAKVGSAAEGSAAEVGSAADVGRIAMVGTRTVGSLKDMVGTECVGEHVSLCESFARCVSRPEWLTLNRSLYCLIALRFADWFFRYGLFPDHVMDVGSLKCSASEAVGAVGCLEWPSPKLVGAVGCVCMFVLLWWLVRRLVAVR